MRAAPRFDVTALGEATLRLSVPSGERLERADTMDVAIASTEANVLCSLTSLGWRTSWLSAVPDSPFGRRVESTYRAFGVDLSGVRKVPGTRLGNHFVEYGRPPRPTRVFFDRANSAFSQMTPDDVAWEVLLDSRLVHLTGLSAALSPSVLDVVRTAADRAHDHGVPVSFDVNYRARLWEPDVAGATLAPLLRRADIVLCSRRDAHTLFGITGSAEEVASGLHERFGARAVVVSDGSAGVGAWLNGARHSRPVVPVDIIDRLGAGDGLAAGFLHGWLGGHAVAGLDSAVAMAALALAQRGEQVVTTREELAEILRDPVTDVDR